MKPWNEYKVDTEKFPYPSRREYRKKLQQELDEQPLTKAARQEAEKDLDRLSREWFNEAIKPHQAEDQRLTAMFWEDAREELGYRKYLNSAQIGALEAKAYEDGHAHGFSSIFEQLTDLDEFLTTIFSREDKPNDGKEKHTL